jgi:pyridoxamine 5'-phosphate oxidase
MSPFSLFQTWYSEAEKAQQIEPNAMVLSTIRADGRPSSRVVLLKHTEDQTFYFFTNYNSEKSKALFENKWACLNFHWRNPFHRQIRMEGEIFKASSEISDMYFKTRPRGSQIGAWSSPQSQKIQNREELEQRVAEYEKKFAGRDVPRPEYWGGFGIKPDRFEFWQEGDFRLHTRRLFILNKSNQWEESLLAP